MINVEWEQTEKQSIAWQHLLDNETTELIFGGGAGGAKSFLLCGFLIVMCGQYPETRWLLGRKRLKRLKETTLKTFFQVCRKWDIKQGRDFIYMVQDGVIHFSNGSEIILADLAHQPSDPDYDDLGSLELTGACIDEVGQITHKCWSVVNSRIRYKLDEYGLVPKCVGSCNPTKGWVYNEFYKPWREKKLSKDKQFIQALAKDNPFNSIHYIKQLEKIKDVATRERLLNGNWEYDDDPSVLFEYDVINDLFTNKAKEDKILYLSGDVSRKGRDNMPLFIWRGLNLLKVVVIPYEIRKNTQQSAKFIKELARRWGIRFSHIILDEDGVGGGVVDAIPGCVGFLNGGSPIISRQEALKKKNNAYYQEWGNLKAQCYFKFEELAENGEIEIAENAFDSMDDKEKFIEELAVIKQRDIDKEGRIFIIDKKELKTVLGRSPDFADAGMMRMWFELKGKDTIVVSDI